MIHSILNLLVKMEWNPYLGPRMSSWMHKLEKDEEMIITLPVIPQPKTPNEPMEFLARSWAPSSTDITQTLAQNHTRMRLSSIQADHEILGASSMATKIGSIGDNGRTSVSVGKWFNGKESLAQGQALKRKDKARLENAHVHAALSIASLASGLATVAASDKYNSSGDACEKMKMAMASATELMASHCVHLAELAGAEHEGLANAVRSSVDIRSAGDLLTLTAAAATALRAEATLKVRLPKDAKKNPAISPYDKCMAAEDQKSNRVHNESRKQNMLCTGELLQQTHKGATRWKYVTIYVNKKSQVMMKMKNKHIGGAFSKKKKCIVYGVCDETSSWPFRKEKQETEEVCLGLKTGKGFMEFKCRSKILKDKWVEGIRSLLSQVDSLELTKTRFLDSLVISKGQYGSEK